jgi:hypothetical protein
MGESELTPLNVPEPDSELADRVATELGVDRYRAEQVIQTVRAEYSGPIPPSSEIRALNAIEPGLGTRLVEDHLSQRAHDRQCDLEEVILANKDAMRKDRWLAYANRGQLYGLLSLLAFAAAALTALLLGHPAVAVAFLSPAIVGAIAKFIEGRSDGKQDRETAK